MTDRVQRKDEISQGKRDQLPPTDNRPKGIIITEDLKREENFKRNE